MGAKGSDSSTLAWVGWEMRLPADWRPHRIEGGWERGAIILGTAEEAVLQVKWWRPEGKEFDADRWLKRRVRSVRAADVSHGGPKPKGFLPTAWVAAYAPVKGDAGALWYGYARAARLVLEAVVSGSARGAERTAAVRRCLPSLRCSAADAATRWSIYGASFVSPAGFRLLGRRLNLGDVALLLAGERGARLMLRQVYPASLALARRELGRWLDFPVFPELRRFRTDGPPIRWTVTAGGKRLEGVRRSGHKRLAFPLGGLRARRSAAAVVHDTELDRLLMCEHDSPGGASEPLLGEAIAGMNWAMAAGGAE